MRKQTARAEVPFGASPSMIARYFFHGCERFLRYRATRRSAPDAKRIPRPERENSAVMESVLQSGYDWEERVVAEHLDGCTLVPTGSGPLRERRFGRDETLEVLRSARAGQHIYQATLRPPALLYEELGIDPAVVEFSDNHPDLIRVDAGPGRARRLRVIDVKRGGALRLVHRVQVLLYALQLDALLRASELPSTLADLDEGEVWLGDTSTPEPFAFKPLVPHVQRFLREDLPRIVESPLDDLDWHVSFRCEWCEYFTACRQDIVDRDDVSRIAHLSRYGKRFLRREHKVDTLAKLETLLRREDADAVLARSASLAGRRHYLAGQVQALLTGAPQALGAVAHALPVREHLALFLTLQEEPLGGRTYLAGALMTGRPEPLRAVFGGSGKPTPAVWVARDPEDTKRVHRVFVRHLHDTLAQVDAFNRAHTEWADQLSLQCYVHAEHDRALLARLLMEALHDPEAAPKAMDLLLLFHGPDLVVTKEHPGDPVAFPLIVLLDALGRLLALPVDVSYTLPESLAALGSTFEYRRRDDLHFPLGHGLRAEVVLEAWSGGRPDGIERLEKLAGQHLWAVASLLGALRRHASEALVCWPPRFRMPSRSTFTDPLLSQLAFFCRYESLLGCQAVRAARCEPRPVQLLLGTATALVAESGTRFRVDDAHPAELDASDFLSALLVRDDEDGRRAQLQYADYPNRGVFWGGGKKSAQLAVVGVEKVETDDDGLATAVSLKLHRRFEGADPQEGERFLLQPRFTDYTSDTVVGHLEGLDREGDRRYARLLLTPGRAAVRRPLPDEVARRAATATRGFRLTPSQREAYAAICEKAVSAVWGPPGTGKTHFLASVILALALAHQRAGVPFRALVTAFTHAAIENVLRKLTALREERGLRLDLAVAKARSWHGDDEPAAEVVERAVLPAWIEAQERSIVGATSFECVKALGGRLRFDLVLVDEASQVRVPEASIPATLVGPKGRLMLAGDDLQLPPIVAGTYPEAAPGEPVLHRSIFEAVRRGGASKGSLGLQLVENFRMNDVLTSHAAALLYGPAYRCASPAVARRRLPFAAPKRLSALLRACLDPVFPLVVVVLDGVQAPKANATEAALVADLVVALRAGLAGEDGQKYADDEAFFRRGVFVVSPHHAQIALIRRELGRRRRWTRPPFVDTVDKMQGQEADAVVVSYGVSDPEFATREAAFIYSVNRLNVAITRARTKSIVCLPRPLLEATPELLDDPEAARGLGFMRGLVDTVAAGGETLRFDLGDGVSVEVVRTNTAVVA